MISLDKSSGAAAHPLSHADAADLETGATSCPTSPTVKQSMQRRPSRWSADVDPKHVAAVPIACAFISGLVDSTMFNAFSTFVAMQTGNTIFLALGTSKQDASPYAWAKSLLAIGCFAFGSFSFARLPFMLPDHVSPRARLTLFTSFTIQAVLTLLAAALSQSGAVFAPVPVQAGHSFVSAQLAPIALLSFQSAGQIVAARAVGIMEVPTVVVTSLLCDLWGDQKLFARHNEKRDRRVVAFLLTLVGGIVGGWISKATHGVAVSLWIAGAIKTLIAGAWCVWPAAAAPADDMVVGGGKTSGVPGAPVTTEAKP